MELAELLGVRPGVTALIGGGGKTTMMYTLARELAARGTVVCTTTTHILPPDHLPVLERADREALERRRCVCAGRPAAEGKLAVPVQTIEEPGCPGGLRAGGGRRLPGTAGKGPSVPRTGDTGGGGADGGPDRGLRLWPSHTGGGPPLGALLQANRRVPGGTGDGGGLAALLMVEGFGDLIFVNQAETPERMSEAERLAGLLDRPVFAGSLKGGIWKCLS